MRKTGLSLILLLIAALIVAYLTINNMQSLRSTGTGTATDTVTQGDDLVGQAQDMVDQINQINQQYANTAGE